MKKVGLIGLGVMGLAVAQNLMVSGFEVYGYDIDATRKKLFKAVKGSVCRSVRELAGNVDVLITSLNGGEEYRQHLDGTLKNQCTLRSDAPMWGRSDDWHTTQKLGNLNGSTP